MFPIDACKSRVKIIPFIINSVPTACQFAANSIVIYTINILKSSTRKHSAACANQLIAGYFKFMSYRGNGSSPFYGRITFIAESSAGITGFGASSSFIGNGYRIVHVSGPMFQEVIFINRLIGCIHFGINMEFFVRKGTGGSVCMSNKTHIYIHLHILCEKVVGSPISFCSKTRNLNIGIKIQNTNRKFRKHCRTGIVICSSTSNGNGGCVGFFIDRIFGSESFCQFHMIQLPMVYTVQINNGRNRLNGFNLGCLKIHPINRTKCNSI